MAKSKVAQDAGSKAGKSDQNEALQVSLLKGLSTYKMRPVEVYIWELDGHRLATANPPQDPKAKLITHARLDR